MLNKINRLPIFKYLLFSITLIIIIISIISSVKASGTDYFFNNAIDKNPATLGNYWLDAGLTIPAVSFPDLEVDNLTISNGATYTGSPSIRGTATNEGIITGTASFYDSAVNNGTVNGDGLFYENLSENYGTILGIKKRKYLGQTVFERDFVSDGPWTIIAMGGGGVDFDGCATDENTHYERENGGYFLGYQPISTISDTNFIKLFYPTVGIDISSIPSTSDFSLSINGSPIVITGLELKPSKVTLFFSSSISPNDDVRLSYVVNTTAIVDSQNFNVAPLSNYSISTLTLTQDAPVYSTQVGTKLYMSNNHSGVVSVIDTLTDTITHSIPVEAYPELSVLIGNKLYVNNLQSDSVSIIDTTNDTVIDTLYVGDGPYFSTVVGTKIYVSNTNSNTISVIDSITDSVVASITVGYGPWFSSQVGTKLYVPNLTSNTVSVINLETDAVIATINTDIFNSGTRAVVVGDKIYVGGDTSMSVINSLTDTIETTINGLSGTYFSCVIGNKLFAPNRSAGTLSIINSSTDTVISTITVGSQPTTCVVIGTKVYVTHNLSNQISVIDSVTNTLIENIIVGSKPFYATAVGHKLFVSNNNSDNFSVFDTTSITSQLPNLTSFSSITSDGTYAQGQAINITANFGRSLKAGSTMTIALNSGASVVLSTVSGTTLSGTYTIGAGEATPDLGVTSITSASVTDSTNTYTRTSYSLPSSQGNLVAENSFITRNLGDNTNIIIGSYQKTTVGSNPYQVTTPITVNSIPYLYVANQGDDTVSVVRQTDHTVVATIPVGSEPYGVVPVTLSGTTYVYVANTGSNDVSVINTTSNAVVTTVSVGSLPYYITAVGSQVYTTNGRSNTVSVINANTNTVTDTISVGVYPRGIKAHGTDLYVANYGDPNYSGGNSISVISSLTNTVTDTIVLPAGVDGPRGVTVLGSNVYIANFRSNNVSIINTATNTVTTTVAVGAGPRGMAAIGSNVYIENFEDGTVSVLDTNTNTVTSTIQVGNAPAGIVASGTDLYITRFQDNSMSILNTVTGSLRTTFSIISNLSNSSLGPTSAGFNWSTDKATISTLEYGLTTSYGSSVSSGTLMTNHSQQVTGLATGTTYHYRVTAVDVDTNLTTSSDGTFRTTVGGNGIGIGRNPIIITPIGPDSPTGSEQSNTETTTVDVRPDQSTPSRPLSVLDRISSKIFIDVNDRGRLWYQFPTDGKRYPVTSATALELFRSVALGITNKNLEQIPVSSSNQAPPSLLAQRLKNMFLLQVENRGQTWYVDQLGFRHFVTRLNIIDMSRNVMTGILNKELNKIEVGQIKK